jgi:hypothetical protein
VQGNGGKEVSLGTEQERFAAMLGDLLVWATQQGYKIRIGDVFAHDGHKVNSNHYIKLAADLYVYKPGETEQDEEAHRRMHDCWDKLGGAPRIEADMNHYSLAFGGGW